MRSGILTSSLAVVALVVASPAFAQQAPTTTSPQGQMQRQMPPAGQTEEHKLREKDKNFAKEAAMGGMFEVELGKVAQQNASNEQVKQFGERMVRDHGAADRELKVILAAKDLSVPQQLEGKQQQTIDRLSKMRGAEFDRAYMRDMVEDHDKDVKAFRQAAQTLSDPDLKAFAQKTLPVLEEHEKLAHEVSKSLAAVGTSREPQEQRNR